MPPDPCDQASQVVPACGTNRDHGLARDFSNRRDDSMHLWPAHCALGFRMISRSRPRLHESSHLLRPCGCSEIDAVHQTIPQPLTMFTTDVNERLISTLRRSDI